MEGGEEERGGEGREGREEEERGRRDGGQEKRGRREREREGERVWKRGYFPTKRGNKVGSHAYVA